ncbi:hypothetical protein [Actinomadura rupiterrae]|uniref:hypothetical protein n=1 Tax=Actinomadura rupiterrae TaxID=559627 RepID=UPI0020A3A5CB|nr:hypothetical protein [Actinomadura rupiterrae]MCP2337335.1 hypothetical protein [Actinomadura rupiterrae]
MKKDWGTWCGSWLSDPSVAYGKQQMKNSVAYGPNNSWLAMYEGYYGPHWYAWSYMQAPVGSYVNTIWFDANSNEYFCGDSSGASDAQVWPGKTSTYTAGIRDDQAKSFKACGGAPSQFCGPAWITW